LLDIGVGQGWRAILKLAEFGDPLGFEQVYARRQHLTELDEGRPQLLQPHAQPFRPGMAGQLLAGPAADHPEAGFKVLIKMQMINQVAEAVLEQHPQDLLIAGDVPVGAVDRPELPDADHQALLTCPPSCPPALPGSPSC
jgi:hypothetical protein